MSEDSCLLFQDILLIVLTKVVLCLITDFFFFFASNRDSLEILCMSNIHFPFLTTSLLLSENYIFLIFCNLGGP